VELVDTSDLKSDSIKSIGSIPVTSNFTSNICCSAKMMELVDMLGLGSSSLKSRGSSPLFGKNLFEISIWLRLINFVKNKKAEKKKKS
jgi:hypothetical protein